jgi:hypothetical protein
VHDHEQPGHRAPCLRCRPLPLAAGVGLLIANGTFLHRDDFTSRFIFRGTTGMAAVDWDGASAALTAGELPCSGGEQRIFRLAASLAGASRSTSATPSPGSTSTTSSDILGIALIVIAAFVLLRRDA